MVGEIPRGQEAMRVLIGRRDFTIERLRAAAFDPYLTAFARLVPRLVEAFDSLAGEAGCERLGRAGRDAPGVGPSLVRRECADVAGGRLG